MNAVKYIQLSYEYPLCNKSQEVCFWRCYYEAFMKKKGETEKASCPYVDIVNQIQVEAS